MKRIVSIDSKIQSLCAGDVELKESAKRVKIYFKAYLKFNKIFKSVNFKRHLWHT